MAITASSDAIDSPPSSTSLSGLDGVNFFLAGMQSGFGPFVAVLLADEKWTLQNIGFVLSVSGLDLAHPHRLHHGLITDFNIRIDAQIVHPNRISRCPALRSDEDVAIAVLAPGASCERTSGIKVLTGSGDALPKVEAFIQTALGLV
jgi:hypothetical protein